MQYYQAYEPEKMKNTKNLESIAEAFVDNGNSFFDKNNQPITQIA